MKRDGIIKGKRQRKLAREGVMRRGVGGGRGRYVRSGCFVGTWPTIDIAMVSRGGRRRGGGEVIHHITYMQA